VPIPRLAAKPKTGNSVKVDISRDGKTAHLTLDDAVVIKGREGDLQVAAGQRDRQTREPAGYGGDGIFAIPHASKRKSITACRALFAWRTQFESALGQGPDRFSGTALLARLSHGQFPPSRLRSPCRIAQGYAQLFALEHPSVRVAISIASVQGGLCNFLRSWIFVSRVFFASPLSVTSWLSSLSIALPSSTADRPPLSLITTASSRVKWAVFTVSVYPPLRNLPVFGFAAKRGYRAPLRLLSRRGARRS